MYKQLNFKLGSAKQDDRKYVLHIYIPTNSLKTRTDKTSKPLKRYICTLRMIKTIRFNYKCFDRKLALY